MADRFPVDIGRRALLKSAGVAASAVVVGLSGIGLGPEEDLEALQTDDGPRASEIAWQRDYGGELAGDVTLRHLRQTDGGGYALVGDGAASAETESTADRFVLVKTAPDGTEQWTTTATATGDGDLTGNARASATTQTGDGGFAVVGRLESPSDGHSDTTPQRHAVAIKFDDEGEREWLETTGTRDEASRASFAGCAPGDADGGLVACGSTDARAWVVKFGPDGRIEWEQTLDGDPETEPEDGEGTTDAEARSISPRAEGGYHLFTNRGTSNRAQYSAVTVDGSGAVERRVVLDVRHSRAAADHDFARRAGGYAYTGREGANATLTALDEVGDEVWHRTFDGPFDGSNRGVEVLRTGDGGLLVGGFAGDATDDRVPALVKTDAAGETQWRRRYDDSGRSDVDAVVETADGGYAFLDGNAFTKLTPDEVPESGGERDTPDVGSQSGPSEETVTGG